MSTSSANTGVLAASALVFSGRNRINAVSIFGDGVNAGTLSIYDNTSAAGKIAVKAQVKAADYQNHIIFTQPVYMENGIYCSLVGTNTNYIVYFGA
jgi:hypothetical protein